MSNSSLICCKVMSPNHSGKRTMPIDRVSIHCMAGNLSVESCGALFQRREASSQYGVGSDGRIALYVDEANRSWCTSSRANDQRAVTIEVANTQAVHPWPISDKAYNSTLKLLVDICKRNGKNKVVWFPDKDKTLAYEPKSNEMVLTVHRWFAAKACPGDYIYDRLDTIAKDANKLLGGGTAPVTPPAQTTTAVGFSIGDTVEFTKEASRYNPTAPGIPAWVKSGYTHIITQTTANGQPVTKGGERCVLLGKKTNRTTGKTEAGINTWVSEKNLRLVVNASGTVPETEPFKPYRVKVTATDLNIRKGPATGYPSKGFIEPGVYTIVLEDATAKWGKLKSGAGWICLEYAKKI